MGAMRQIRPKAIFTLIDDSRGQPLVHVPMPTRPGLGGLMLLETFLLLACRRIVGAKRLFEFGTFLGSTTYSLALNTPDDAEIFTLDLDEASAAGLEQPADEVPITKLHLERRAKLDFLGTPAERKIKLLIGDSTKLDFTPWRESINFAFIDGGHDGPTVKSDTENALQLLDRDAAGCILWHDYGNPDCLELKEYLDSLSETMEMFHVQDTWLCVYFHDPDRELVARLSNI